MLPLRLYFTLSFFSISTLVHTYFLQNSWIYTIWSWWFIGLELLYLLYNFLILNVNLCQGHHLIQYENCLRNRIFPKVLSSVLIWKPFPFFPSLLAIFTIHLKDLKLSLCDFLLVFFLLNVHIFQLFLDFLYFWLHFTRFGQLLLNFYHCLI